MAIGSVRSSLVCYLAVIDFLRVEVVIHQSVLGHLLILRARTTPVAVWVDRDAAARREFAPYFDITRIHHFDQIVHDDVHAVFVEIPMVAEAEQIQLERLALNHLLIGDIGDIDRREIWLSGHRT